MALPADAQLSRELLIALSVVLYTASTEAQDVLVRFFVFNAFHPAGALSEQNQRRKVLADYRATLRAHLTSQVGKTLVETLMNVFQDLPEEHRLPDYLPHDEPEAPADDASAKAKARHASLLALHSHRADLDIDLQIRAFAILRDKLPEPLHHLIATAPTFQEALATLLKIVEPQDDNALVLANAELVAQARAVKNLQDAGLFAARLATYGNFIDAQQQKTLRVLVAAGLVNAYGALLPALATDVNAAQKLPGATVSSIIAVVQAAVCTLQAFKDILGPPETHAAAAVAPAQPAPAGAPVAAAAAAPAQTAGVRRGRGRVADITMHGEGVTGSKLRTPLVMRTMGMFSRKVDCSIDPTLHPLSLVKRFFRCSCIHRTPLHHERSWLWLQTTSSTKDPPGAISDAMFSMYLTCRVGSKHWRQAESRTVPNLRPLSPPAWASRASATRNSQRWDTPASEARLLATSMALSLKSKPTHRCPFLARYMALSPNPHPASSTTPFIRPSFSARSSAGWALRTSHGISIPASYIAMICC
mmetsp:Transcript_16535/g.39811  ORF Transcript_16535/g.39811 Transcript_16535/m.39811 type:complete len:532 (-) Transcript_16535:104-1699(-)